MEEIGITVTNLKFNKSEYFEKSSTLMLNFSCEAATEKLDNINYKEVDFAEWLSVDDARKSIKSSSLAQEFLFAFLSNSEKQKSDLNL